MLNQLWSALRAFSREAGIRFLARRRAACAVAILTMGLALGANTAVFSVVKAFLLSSIALPEPDRVFVVAPLRDLPGRPAVLFSEAYPNYRLIRATQKVFVDVTCVAQGVVSWDDHGESRPLRFSRVTASFFPTMRVYPMLGAAFAESDEGPSPKPVAVIGHALWQSGFAGDSAVIGKPMRVNGELYTIVGVMPPGFAQPAPTEIWLPFDIPPQQRAAITGARTLGVYARLADGRSVSAGAEEARALTKRALDANSVDNKDFRYELRSLRTVLLNGADSTVLLVQTGAVVLLLLAVLNLALLLVAWGFDRRQEMAVRAALGAGTGRIVRMLFLQSLVVVAAGAVVGIGVATAAMPWVRQLDINPSLTFFVSRIQLDGTVLTMSGLVAIIAGLAAGVLPAWFNRRADLAMTLRAGSRAVTLTPAALRWQQGMVFVQAALSVVILATAALIGVSFRNISRVRDGYDPANLLVARVQLREPEYTPNDKRAEFGRRLLENLSTEPALASAAFTSTLPVSDLLWGARFFVEMPDGSVSSDAMLLHFRRVSPGYLEAMHIPLVQGRQIDANDDAAKPLVVIISQTLANRLWPGVNPVGKRIYRVVTGSRAPTPVEIVGVAGDVMDAGATAPPGETAYVPYPQVPQLQISIVVRPRGSDEAALDAIRHALKQTDPYMAAHSTARLATLTRQANALPRLRSLLLLVFGVVAIGIVALGSYGVMSQLVANREREFAMRLIFGAAPQQLGRSVMMHVARLTVPGVAVGLAIVTALGGSLKGFVFGIEPRSVTLLVTVGAAMVVIAALAAAPSALRAMRVDVRRGASG